MIPFNRAAFDGKELTYLAQAVIDGHVSGNGPFTKRAEAILTERHEAGPVLLTTSCTHALELAGRLAGIEPGDEVIVPAFTFVSTAAAFVLAGARPVFVDVDPDTLNIDPDLAEAAVTDRTRAICIVHYGGVGASPDRFVDLADRHGLLLVEDNAHGLFGRWDGRLLGTFGALSTLSFHETKNVTSGEGGALVVNDPALVERAEILREKGTNRARFMRGQVDRYTWVEAGSSWVMSDLLAGVLCGQLERFDEIHAKRMHLWDTYAAALADWGAAHGVRLPVIPVPAEHTAHVFHLRFADADVRDRFIAHLRDRGVAAVFHYQPLNTSEMGLSFGGRAGQCPIAEDAGETLVRLPLHVGLGADDQATVIEAVLAFVP
jgi:dTDP-4-amino-4,6-dideoxygalactose transaminase